MPAPRRLDLQGAGTPSTKEDRQLVRGLLDGKARDNDGQREVLAKLQRRNLLPLAIQHLCSQAASVLPVLPATPRGAIATPRGGGMTSPRGSRLVTPRGGGGGGSSSSAATPRGGLTSPRGAGGSITPRNGGSITSRVQRITAQQREALKYQATLLGRATRMAGDSRSVVQCIEGLRLRETAVALCNSGRNVELHFLVQFVGLLLEPWRGQMSDQTSLRDEIYSLYTTTNTRVAYPTQVALLDLLVLLWDEPGSPGLLTASSTNEQAGIAASGACRRPGKRAAHPHTAVAAGTATVPPPITVALARVAPLPPPGLPVAGEPEPEFVYEAVEEDDETSSRVEVYVEDVAVTAATPKARAAAPAGGVAAASLARHRPPKAHEAAALRHQPSDSARSVAELLAEAKAAAALQGDAAPERPLKQQRVSMAEAEAEAKAATAKKGKGHRGRKLLGLLKRALVRS